LRWALGLNERDRIDEACVAFRVVAAKALLTGDNAGRCLVSVRAASVAVVPSMVRVSVRVVA
jgi:hypothetical protein